MEKGGREKKSSEVREFSIQRGSVCVGARARTHRDTRADVPYTACFGVCTAKDVWKHDMWQCRQRHGSLGRRDTGQQRKRETEPERKKEREIERERKKELKKDRKEERVLIRHLRSETFETNVGTMGTAASEEGILWAD